MNACMSVHFDSIPKPRFMIAKMKLDGRWFGGRQITAHHYNMGFYEVDDLSH